MLENQDIEFKTIWKDEYLKWVCGMANANGGIIYIGLNNEGISFSQKILEFIAFKIRSRAFSFTRKHLSAFSLYPQLSFWGLCPVKHATLLLSFNIIISLFVTARHGWRLRRKQVCSQ